MRLKHIKPPEHIASELMKVNLAPNSAAPFEREESNVIYMGGTMKQAVGQRVSVAQTSQYSTTQKSISNLTPKFKEALKLIQ